MPEPLWWADLCRGLPARLDKLTRDQGFTVDGDGFSQESLYTLGGTPPPALQSGSACKRARSRQPRASATTAAPCASAPAPVFNPPVLPSVVRGRLEHFPRRQFVCKGPWPDLSRPGGLDLFSGVGGVARALVRHGCPWVLTFDCLRGASEDLSAGTLQRELLELLRLGAFLCVGGSPPCASFSRALAPPVRSAAAPAGVPHLPPGVFAKVVRDNRWSAWLLELKCVAQAAGVLFWFENPDLSFLWRMPGWEEEANEDRHQLLSCRSAPLTALLAQSFLPAAASVKPRTLALAAPLLGGPRTQHLRVDFPAAVELITAGVHGLAWEEPVYPFGPATYRRRWDMLLTALGLGQCELTPGGLRGGGAVWAYHHGTAIADIQWRMRLKHQHTLVHYLQEVAALNALLDAGADSRIRLRQVAELFPFVVLSF
ncbi:unnamed protein product [Symbiodinium necroappetens]|uniref:Uncharacterized protein n=1 Tax=Symbiodinium necroappetens TaxID=1628268 RepID=A0A812PXV6_9DINO|nr:unnamed protein product [Symbiodinium necroappetens]